MCFQPIFIFALYIYYNNALVQLDLRGTWTEWRYRSTAHVRLTLICRGTVLQICSGLLRLCF